MVNIETLIRATRSLIGGVLRRFIPSPHSESNEMAFSQSSIDSSPGCPPYDFFLSHSRSVVAVWEERDSCLPTLTTFHVFSLGRTKGVMLYLLGRLEEEGKGERPSIDGKDMKELLHTYSDRQLVDLISTGGVTFLGSLRLREGVVMKAFGNDKVIWEMHDQAADAPWKQIWENRLTSAKASTAHGPTQYWKAMAYVVTLKNAGRLFDEGLLHPIVNKLESGTCPPSVFSAPLVRAVVWFKWHWARRVIFVEFLIFLVWLIAFLIHASLYDPKELHKGFWRQDREDRVAFVASLISTIFMCPFSYISSCEVIYNGLSHWFTFWNLFDALAQICQMVCFAVYFFGSNIDHNTYAIMLGTQTVLLVLKIQYFARAVLAVEVAFIDNLNRIIREAAMFLLLWATTVISFAIAMYVVFKKDLQQEEGNDEIEFYYGTVFHSVFTLFGSMFKRFTYDPLMDSERSTTVTLLFSVFLFLNTITFYNLIASIVVSSHKKIKERSQASMDTGRAYVLVELETATPRFFLKRLDKPYIHFLKLVPPEEIDMTKLWTTVRYADDKAVSQKEALSKRLHEAETEIMHEIELTVARSRVQLRGRPSQ